MGNSPAVIALVVALLSGYESFARTRVAIIDTGVSRCIVCRQSGWEEDYCRRCTSTIEPPHSIVAEHVPDLSDWVDRHGHGSFVVEYLLRFAPTHPQVISIKAFDFAGQTRATWMVSAIKKAIDIKAHIILLSNGAAEYDDGAVAAAVTYAIRYGAAVLAAAGNDGPSPGSVLSPAILPGVVSVTACSFYPAHHRHPDAMPGSESRCPLELLEFSSRGPAVSAAGQLRFVSGASLPGFKLAGVGLLNYPVFKSGTSVAAPLMAALVASGTQWASDLVWWQAECSPGNQTECKGGPTYHRAVPRSLPHWVQLAAYEHVRAWTRLGSLCNATSSQSWWDELRVAWSLKWQLMRSHHRDGISYGWDDTISASTPSSIEGSGGYQLVTGQIPAEQPMAVHRPAETRGKCSALHSLCHMLRAHSDHSIDASGVFRPTEGLTLDMVKLTRDEATWLHQLEVGRQCGPSSSSDRSFIHASVLCNSILFPGSLPLEFSVDLVGTGSIAFQTGSNAHAEWSPVRCWTGAVPVPCSERQLLAVSYGLEVRASLAAQSTKFSAAQDLTIRIQVLPTDSAALAALEPLVLEGDAAVDVPLCRLVPDLAVVALEAAAYRRCKGCSTRRLGAPAHAFPVHIGWAVGNVSSSEHEAVQSCQHPRGISTTTVRARFRFHSRKPPYRFRMALDTHHSAAFPRAKSYRDDLRAASTAMDAAGDSIRTNFGQLLEVAGRQGVILDEVHAPLNTVDLCQYGAIIIPDPEVPFSSAEKFHLWGAVWPTIFTSYTHTSDRGSQATEQPDGCRPTSAIVLAEWDDKRLYPGGPTWNQNEQTWWTYSSPGAQSGIVDAILGPAYVRMVPRSASGVVRYSLRSSDLVLPSCEDPIMAELRSASPIGVLPRGAHMQFAWMHDDVVDGSARSHDGTASTICRYLGPFADELQVPADRSGLAPFGYAGCEQQLYCSKWGVVIAALDEETSFRAATGFCRHRHAVSIDAAGARPEPCSADTSGRVPSEPSTSNGTHVPAHAQTAGRIIVFSDTACIDSDYRWPSNTIDPNAPRASRLFCRGLLQHMIRYAAFGRRQDAAVFAQSGPLSHYFVDPIILQYAAADAASAESGSIARATPHAHSRLRSSTRSATPRTEGPRADTVSVWLGPEPRAGRCEQEGVQTVSADISLALADVLGACDYASGSR